ncbi:MAG: leucyl aminopeptidase family protein [Candidatus Aenigmarchaeota archaeon]|nr:leucyl aminopeptidase family protein [Candidatus Aenigmarchaeota archaeon]
MQAVVVSKTDWKSPVVEFFCEEDVRKVEFFDNEMKAEIQKFINSGLFSGKKFEIVPVTNHSKKIVILAGCGKTKELSPTQMRIITAKLVHSQVISGYNTIQIIPMKGRDSEIAEGVVIGGYTWEKYLTEKAPGPSKAMIKSSNVKEVEKIIFIAESVNYARDLVNDDSDFMNSVQIEREVKKLVSGKKGFSVKVLEEKELKKLGLNLILAVNGASPYPPKLIIAKYNGGKGKYTAFVGKGVTYDSGGLGLKPSEYMKYMRDDIGGVAVLMGVMRNVIKFRPKKNFIFALPLVENMIGSKAYKTGKIIKSYSGKTVEVEHTDAEGRLILADALAYVDKNYKPETMIDIATLTGACITALGYDYMALMSRDDELADSLLKSGQKTNDRMWRMPLYPELLDYLKTKDADINTLGPPRVASVITAGEFLSRFVGNTRWAHIDIGAAVFVNDDHRWYFGHGATGKGVRILTDFILSH